VPLSYQVYGVEEIRWLRDAYGETLILTEDGPDSEPYRILAEFTYEGRPYAVLQSKKMEKEEHDVAIFRLSRVGDLIDLETIEEDEEWEQISEVYDDMWFA
jgi:uncharacterized protein YrzB (UPF0473 family)